MSAKENMDTVRRGYAAFNSGDVEALTAVFHEGATWRTPGRSARAGLRHGREAVFGHFGDLGGESGGTFRATLQQIFQSEDGRVVALHRNTAQRNGKSLDIACCLVFDFKDGRISGGTEHFDDLYAWDAFWA